MIIDRYNFPIDVELYLIAPIMYNGNIVFHQNKIIIEKNDIYIVKLLKDYNYSHLKTSTVELFDVFNTKYLYITNTLDDYYEIEYKFYKEISKDDYMIKHLGRENIKKYHELFIF